MYVHVGDEIMVRSSEIIVMLEKETVRASEEIQRLLSEKKDQVINLTNGPYKSVIFVGAHIYLSPIAISTLKKRLLKTNSYDLIT